MSAVLTAKRMMQRHKHTEVSCAHVHGPCCTFVACRRPMLHPRIDRHLFLTWAVTMQFGHSADCSRWQTPYSSPDIADTQLKHWGETYKCLQLLSWENVLVGTLVGSRQIIFCLGVIDSGEEWQEHLRKSIGHFRCWVCNLGHSMFFSPITTNFGRRETYQEYYL